jgi:hypothetical protein
MSLTKDGFDNIEGQMFEVIRGVEGDCLTLGDEDGGTRISGPKPWGGGQVVKTFVTCEKYGPIEHLEAENANLMELVRIMWLAGDFRAFLGVEEIKERMREFGIEVNDD